MLDRCAVRVDALLEICYSLIHILGLFRSVCLLFHLCRTEASVMRVALSPRLHLFIVLLFSSSWKEFSLFQFCWKNFAAWEHLEFLFAE